MGSLYTRKGSQNIWIQYYQHGRPVRESTGTTNKVVARRVLRSREGDVERSVPINPKMGLITFEDAAEDSAERLQGQRSEDARPRQTADSSCT